MSQLLNDFGQSVVERAQRNIGSTRTVNGKKRRIDSSGQLRKSLMFKVKETKGRVIFTFGAKGAASKYADVVEDGRRPGKFPPPDAIKQWIKDKPIRLRDTNTNKFIKSTEAKINSLAFLIGRSIKIKGIPGTKFFENALQDEIADRGNAFFNELADEILARITPVTR